MKNRLVLFKYGLCNPKAYSFHRSGSKNQFLSLDELEHINWEKRKKLVEYAYHNVPWYRHRWAESGVSPPDLVHSEDYQKLPVLSKGDVRRGFADLVATGVSHRHLKLTATGGSTGEPLKTYLDKRWPRHIAEWRMSNWWGLEPGVDKACVWRQAGQSQARKLLVEMLWWPTRRVYLDAAKMTPEAIDRFISVFNRLKPPLIFGYSGALAHLADYVETNGIRMHVPKAIWVTASPTSSTQRARIESAFDAPVYDQYGCCEVPYIAAQCRERRGLHILHDTVHIESVDDEGRPCPIGAPGKVIITDLENYAFPLIRYANGDIGRALPGRCPCGMTLPLMHAVKGRTTDMVYLPDGSTVSGEYLTTIFDDFPDAVKAFQVHQQSDYSLDVLAVPNTACGGTENVFRNVVDALVANVSGQVPVRLMCVDEIPHDRGKTRFVISDVKH